MGYVLLPNPERCSIIMNSQDGSSEAFIGEWAEQRGIRDRLFSATTVFKWVSTILNSVVTSIVLVLEQHRLSQRIGASPKDSLRWK